MNFPDLQLALSALNVLVIPALWGVGRWLMRVELRLARLEWSSEGHAPKTDAP